MKAIKILLKLFFLNFLLLLFLFPFDKEALAIVDPLSSPNNIFGIHIIDEADLEDASKLVNSNNGDWGYVTLVIRKDQKDKQKWQNTFDKMRRLHIIPIIRIATTSKQEVWEKPSFDEIDSWVDFLDSLNWVIKNRYIIIGNEPNHAKEWGGETNPEEYSDYLYQFAKKLKDKSQDFFILPAALDVSAPNDKEHMDSVVFLKRMLDKHPDLFDYIDGLNSHSYPNPKFSGSAKEIGRGTVRTYEWELNLLKSLGVEKKLPVFITETGWVHNANQQNGQNNLLKKISENLIYAFENVWQKDGRIVVVTPFVLNYQGQPFDIFSWKEDEKSFYEFYYKIQLLPKKRGIPLRNNILEIKAYLSPKISSKSKKYGLALVKNIGQVIWERGLIYLISENTKKYSFRLSYPKLVEPGHSGLVILSEPVKEN